MYLGIHTCGMLLYYIRTAANLTSLKHLKPKLHLLYQGRIRHVKGHGYMGAACALNYNPTAIVHRTPFWGVAVQSGQSGRTRSGDRSHSQ